MGGRKFILAIVLISISSILLVLEYLAEENWAYVVTIVSSGYLASNVVNTAVKKYNKENVYDDREPF